MSQVQRISRQIARPLKVLVPLIKTELNAANEAGLEHYRRAGEMLLEAREQLSGGSWTQWLSRNFELSRTTAFRYMRLAEQTTKGRFARETSESLTTAIGESRSKSKWKPLFEAAGRVNVALLADERQSREQEIELRRDLAMQLIDLGYRALATRLHPDRGGSRDAMARLNVVRDELKSVAETRRFV